jgi:hypothetical protein
MRPSEVLLSNWDRAKSKGRSAGGGWDYLKLIKQLENNFINDHNSAASSTELAIRCFSVWPRML